MAASSRLYERKMSGAFKSRSHIVVGVGPDRWLAKLAA
jgi:hypothetical protein